MATAEFNFCSICKQPAQVERIYHYSDIKCDYCKGGKHFEIEYICEKCKPKLAAIARKGK